jgi:hypothetical protein
MPGYYHSIPIRFVGMSIRTHATTRDYRFKVALFLRSLRTFAAIPLLRAYPDPASIPRLRFFRGQMLLELLYLRSDYQLAISLSGILGEIVLMVVFRRIEAL